MRKVAVSFVLSLFFMGAMSSPPAQAQEPPGARAADQSFSTLYAFQALAPNTFTNDSGAYPGRPVLGPGNTVYGMTLDGGTTGNGVIYRFDLVSRQYTLLHTFSALDAKGNNEDGAYPGVALTRGPDDAFYGMASFGGKNGSGTIFKITASGEFTVLHTFSAVDANLHNQDGAYPLRAMIIGRDGNLYGTTRLGGPNTCTGPTRGCGVAWTMDRWGDGFKVLHQFTAGEGHAASIIQGRDGMLYGSTVYPFPFRVTLPSGTLFRMTTSGQDFTVVYRFSQTDAQATNAEGAGVYEPLVEGEPGVFYGTALYGGTYGNGTVFRYSLSNPNSVDVLHTFGAVNSLSANSDGAIPDGRLSLGEDGTMYSNAVIGGTNGNGVIFSIRQNGAFQVLYTFTATDPTTGANQDGANPDLGVILYGQSLIGIATNGGNGSPAGFLNSGGTLYELKLDD